MIGDERLLAICVLGAALAGLGVSTYLSGVHATHAPLVCSVRGLVDCERVLTSAYAQILGTAIPTSAAGSSGSARAACLLSFRELCPERGRRCWRVWPGVWRACSLPCSWCTSRSSSWARSVPGAAPLTCSSCSRCS